MFLCVIFSIFFVFIIGASIFCSKKMLFKNKKFNIEITKMVTEEQIKIFEEMINNKKTTEIMMQKMFIKNPELLAPLQILEIQREFRLVKRDLIKEIILIGSKNNDRIDFIGTKIQPNATPIIIEMKRPNHNILNHNTLRLSKKSSEIIEQLHNYTISLFRYENISNLENKYGWNISESLKEKIKSQLNSYDRVDNKLLNEIFNELNKMEIKLIAIIGNSNEFGLKKDELIEEARKQFLEKNIILITYDELLEANKAVHYIFNSDDSIQNYFHKKRGISFSAGTFTRLQKDEIISNGIMENIKKVILQNKINVCLYGFGPPPDYYIGYQTPYNFDIRKIADPPRFLGGEEDVKWAGRFDDHWIVIKKRLSEPFMGKNVLYEFFYPIFDGSTRIV